MPCDDITEILTMDFDAQDRLTGYKLTKRSCGRAVGQESLLLEWAEDSPAEALAAFDVECFLDAFPTEDETEEFLFLKHFFALKSGVAVYLGYESGGANDPCAMGSVAYGPEGTEVVVELKIDVLAEKIKSCGRCGKGCGAAKKIQRAAQAGA